MKKNHAIAIHKSLKKIHATIVRMEQTVLKKKVEHIKVADGKPIENIPFFEIANKAVGQMNEVLPFENYFQMNGATENDTIRAVATLGLKGEHQTLPTQMVKISVESSKKDFEGALKRKIFEAIATNKNIIGPQSLSHLKADFYIMDMTAKGADQYKHSTFTEII